MNAQWFVIAGVVVGYVAWSGLPKARPILRMLPIIALALAALQYFISTPIPAYFYPALIGAATATAVLTPRGRR
jgi:hypothetical protein